MAEPIDAKRALNEVRATQTVSDNPAPWAREFDKETLPKGVRAYDEEFNTYSYSLGSALATLWAAVQHLSEKVEQLESGR